MCCLSKVLEKCVHTQLIKYVESNNILDPSQYGYRKGLITQTLLIKMTDDMLDATYTRKITTILFFDFGKGIDLVPHNLLLMKLQFFALLSSVLKWFASYLSCRRQSLFMDRIVKELSGVFLELASHGTEY